MMEIYRRGRLSGPDPRIGYSLRLPLEARGGSCQIEGQKHRPCVVVLCVEEIDGEKVVTVAPVTHNPRRIPIKPSHSRQPHVGDWTLTRKKTGSWPRR